MFLICFPFFKFLVGLILNFMAYFVFFEKDKTHFNSGIQINLIDVRSTNVRCEEEPSHSTHPNHQTNVNVEGI